MARYTGPACKLCRREGKKLYLKGDRCLSGKCALDRRATAPGQHGAAKKKMREYGLVFISDGHVLTGQYSHVGSWTNFNVRTVSIFHLFNPFSK